MKNIKVIALGSTRMVGKDTFYALLCNCSPKFYRIAFADHLKYMINPLCRELFAHKIVNELSPSEKEIIRPVMISVGEAARKIDQDFWIKKAYQLISLNTDAYSIPVITDMRYLNEYNYFKNIYGDSFLFIDINRVGAPEPTAEEQIYAPPLKKVADVSLTWDTDPTMLTLQTHVNGIYEKYFKELTW